jgi:VWFA-related protein
MINKGSPQVGVICCSFLFSRLCAWPCLGFFWLGLLVSANGQEIGIAPSNSSDQVEKTGNFNIQVGVEEVRIDAVVVDRKGRQITDLTAGEFQIYQDGQPQKVISSTYITNNQVQPVKRIVPSQDSRTTPKISTSAPAGDDIRRTIVFLVDDLSMGMPDIQNARMSLQRFVETQMQPGDLVAIMQTTGGNAGLQPFSSDKRKLLARIAKIKWNPMLSRPASLPQVVAIAYNIRALRDMPGRKFLLLLSTQVMIPDQLSKDSIFDRLADEALRAGVVIHTLDIMGLVNDATIRVEKEDPRTGEIRIETLPLDAQTQAYEDPGLKELRPPNAAERRLATMAARRLNRPLPLSQKTGGLFLTDNNFFVNGIGDAEEEMRGYYLLSYAPPANTFNPASPTAYHKVTIRVKRPGSEVHTRDGFYGTREALREPDKSQDSLMEAMFSPFRYHDLTLNLASGYIHDPQKGYLLRAWLHVNGRRLGFIKEKDGGYSVSLEAVATTSDIDGLAQDSVNTQVRFRVNYYQIQWIRENGINFSLSLPARKAGAYYLRAAVKDHASGAMGSAYQFLEMPDLKKDGLSLSSIFVLNRDKDAAWIQSGMTEEPQDQPDSYQKGARRSQALRKYLPGESFDYMAIIYNAKTAEKLTPDLESQSVLSQDGNEIFRSKPEAVDIRGVKNLTEIPIKKQLKLEKTMQPGDYVLQLQVWDKRGRKEKQNPAIQTLDFEVAARVSGTAASWDSLEDAADILGKTVIEMHPEELLQSYPDALSRVKFNLNQDQLNFLLKQAGDRVVAFFRNFSNTSAKEQVRIQRYLRSRYDLSIQKRNLPPLVNQSQLAPMAPLVDAAAAPAKSVFVLSPNILEFKEHSAEFNYLILPGPGNAGTAWIEDRTDKENRSVNPKDISGFIMSSGHAGKCLYLHPSHQANSYFRYLGREERKPRAHVIAFAQKPESGDYLAQYSDDNSSTPIRFLVQGFVWLDPDSYQILRMRTSMLSPEMQTALKETITDISYEKIQFAKRGQEFWLPREINVSWEFPYTDRLNWIYRNQHLYSDYHLFTVDSDYKINQPEVNRE